MGDSLANLAIVQVLSMGVLTTISRVDKSARALLGGTACQLLSDLGHGLEKYPRIASDGR